jgi:hypothetical protein
MLRSVIITRVSGSTVPGGILTLKRKPRNVPSPEFQGAALSWGMGREVIEGDV